MKNPRGAELRKVSITLLVENDLEDGPLPMLMRCLQKRGRGNTYVPSTHDHTHFRDTYPTINSQRNTVTMLTRSLDAESRKLSPTGSWPYEVS